jgi:asparagine synthase (glutamine-hydrolysing)
LRRDVLTGNLRWVLALTDRNAMAHSIEARVPYVSRGMVEFAFSLPDRFKTGAGWRKRILRRVGERHLPRALVYRPNRLGFGTPTGRWLAEAFAAELRGLARGEVFASSGIADPAGIGRFVNAFLAGEHADAGTVWRLYAVDRWARAHSVTGL